MPPKLFYNGCCDEIQLQYCFECSSCALSASHSRYLCRNRPIRSLRSLLLIVGVCTLLLLLLLFFFSFKSALSPLVVHALLVMDSWYQCLCSIVYLSLQSVLLLVRRERQTADIRSSGVEQRTWEINKFFPTLFFSTNFFSPSAFIPPHNNCIGRRIPLYAYFCE